MTPLLETENGDLIIAIGGNGTFLHAVTETNFSKDKIYVGVHTGTLGFLQNLSENDVYDDFIYNSCICQKITIVPKTQKNIQIIIDGISREISSELIKRVEVSMLEHNSYINKLELTPYSKVRVIREKILGYKS